MKISVAIPLPMQRSVKEFDENCVSFAAAQCVAPLAPAAERARNPCRNGIRGKEPAIREALLGLSNPST
jgi:hypothetical protein